MMQSSRKSSRLQAYYVSNREKEAVGAKTIKRRALTALTAFTVLQSVVRVYECFFNEHICNSMSSPVITGEEGFVAAAKISAH